MAAILIKGLHCWTQFCKGSPRTIHTGLIWFLMYDGCQVIAKAHMAFGQDELKMR